jgi:hypothetical protein
MKTEQRYNWIENYLLWLSIRHRTVTYVDVLDAEFVDAFAEATGAKVVVMPYGADKCGQLGRDLSAMFKAGRLGRWACGIWGGSGEGFPKWVYSYHLPRGARHG